MFTGLRGERNRRNFECNFERTSEGEEEREEEELTLSTTTMALLELTAFLMLIAMVTLMLAGLSTPVSRLLFILCILGAIASMISAVLTMYSKHR